MLSFVAAFFFSYFYLFILLFVTSCFSISYQRLLMKENVESVLHLWQNASLLCGGGSRVLDCARYVSSTLLFPLACSCCHSDRKKHVSPAYIQQTLLIFFCCLFLRSDKDLIQHHYKKTVTERFLSVYTFFDQLLLYFFFFSFQESIYFNLLETT